MNSPGSGSGGSGGIATPPTLSRTYTYARIHAHHRTEKILNTRRGLGFPRSPQTFSGGYS
jgi:hypothetical protein